MILILLLLASVARCEKDEGSGRLYSSTCNVDTDWNRKGVARALKKWIQSIKVGGESAHELQLRIKITISLTRVFPWGSLFSTWV